MHYSYSYKSCDCSFIYFLKIVFIIFRQRGSEGEREREKHQCVVASCVPATRDLACNPGMCPDWGIELATLCFSGQRSIHWATPARAVIAVLIKVLRLIFLRSKNYALLLMLFVEWLPVKKSSTTLRKI